jgi:hypothetical protein
MGKAAKTLSGRDDAAYFKQGRDGPLGRPRPRAFLFSAGRRFSEKFRWPKDGEAPAGTAQRTVPTGNGHGRDGPLGRPRP